MEDRILFARRTKSAGHLTFIGVSEFFAYGSLVFRADVRNGIDPLASARVRTGAMQADTTNHWEAKVALLRLRYITDTRQQLLAFLHKAYREASIDFNEQASLDTLLDALLGAYRKESDPPEAGPLPGQYLDLDEHVRNACEAIGYQTSLRRSMAQV